MAGTTVARRETAAAGGTVRQLRVELNKLITDVELLRTAFMAHTHKTPTTNPGATSTPTSDAGGSGSTGGTAQTTVSTAATLLAAMVADQDGVTSA